MKKLILLLSIFFSGHALAKSVEVIGLYGRYETVLALSQSSESPSIYCTSDGNKQCFDFKQRFIKYEESQLEVIAPTVIDAASFGVFAIGLGFSVYTGRYLLASLWIAGSIGPLVGMAQSYGWLKQMEPARQKANSPFDGIEPFIDSAAESLRIYLTGPEMNLFYNRYQIK